MIPGLPLYSKRLVFLLPVAATLAAIASAFAGIWLTNRPQFTRWLVPASGALLIAAAVFGVIPELIGDIGSVRVLPLAAAGFLILYLVDKYVAPVCPSREHDGHAAYLTPLIAATAIHSFVDGWGLVAVRLADTNGAAVVLAAIFLHKIPEGLALGGLVGGLLKSAKDVAPHRQTAKEPSTRFADATVLRAFLKRRSAAAALCLLAESVTLAGGATGLWLTPVQWISWPLALAAGTFVYLGLQAIRPGHHSH